jgi:hypothetical protein
MFITDIAMKDIPENILAEIQYLQDQGHNIDFRILKNQFFPDGYIQGVFKCRHSKNTTQMKLYVVKHKALKR